MTFAVADLDRVHEARARFGIHRQAVYQDVHRFRKIHIQQRFRRREFVHPSGLVQAIETALLQFQQTLTRCVRGRRSRGLLARSFRSARHSRRRDAKLIKNVKPPPRWQQQNTCGDFIRAVLANLCAALDAERLPASREQQPQIIINLRGGRHRRARIACGIFLANCYRWSNPGDFVHVRLFHALEELPRVSRERFDIAALAFRINRVESQRGFARAAHAGDDSDGVVRNVYRDVFEVMDAGAPDAQGVLFRLRNVRRCGDLFSRQSEAQTAGFESTAQTSNYKAAVKREQTSTLRSSIGGIGIRYATRAAMSRNLADAGACGAL